MGWRGHKQGLAPHPTPSRPPARRLAMVTQRMVDVWKGRALAAEAQLWQQEGGGAQQQP